VPVRYASKGGQAAPPALSGRLTSGTSFSVVRCRRYTSGTTGEPKGVVITNRALVSSVSGGLAWLEHHKISLTADDCVFSFLPLAHIFAIQAETNMLSVGGSIAYYRGDIKLLLEDLLEARPTVFAGVPRVYARFQQRIRAAVAAFSPLKRALFHYAYASQLHNVRHGRPRTAIWDALVFNKVRAGLLPRGRIIVTGSAPLSAETSEFLRVCLNAPVLQGYGASETLGGVTCETPSVRGGSCGPPLPGVEIKLVDIPEMGYLTTDAPHPRGEVCVRGPMLMSGYYKRDAATAAAFDGDGFFHTGDVGMRLPDGSLAIIDRLKSLFKLSQGEYVSPEAIENELAKAELVGQIFVYGNSLESTLLAVVVLDIPAASAWAVENAPGVQGIRAIAALPALKAKVLEQLAGEAATARLKRYEYIKDILIEAADYNELGQGWHTGNQLMTPSFKLRRPQLTQKYKERLDLRYAAMS
jgi:long-chain acyl-CoA synthetase